LRALERAKVLTDREREEVDLRCRVVLQGCRERVGVLEVREKSESASSFDKSACSHLTQRVIHHDVSCVIVRQNRTKPSTTSSLLTTFLPSLATDASSTGITPQQRSTILTAHHASILWSLNNSLLTLSDVVREMQEERGKIREERGKSLGGMVDKEFVGGGLGTVLTRRRVGGDGKPIQLTIPTASFARPTASKTSAVDLDPSGSSSSNNDDNAITLSEQQIQQFSSENDTLLESMNTTLNTVLRAEKSLLEISQLQSTLIAHLATQTEAIELLYDEAIETVADLDRANTQLRKAKERGKEGRLYLVVFLIMASLTLLFLDWYS
jgi:syntaxin 18